MEDVKLCTFLNECNGNSKFTLEEFKILELLIYSFTHEAKTLYQLSEQHFADKCKKAGVRTKMTYGEAKSFVKEFRKRYDDYAPGFRVGMYGKMCPWHCDWANRDPCNCFDHDKSPAYYKDGRDTCELSQDQIKTLRNITGNPNLRAESFYFIQDNEGKRWRETVLKAFSKSRHGSEASDLRCKTCRIIGIECSCSRREIMGITTLSETKAEKETRPETLDNGERYRNIIWNIIAQSYEDLKAQKIFLTKLKKEERKKHDALVKAGWSYNEAGSLRKKCQSISHTLRILEITLSGMTSMTKSLDTIQKDKISNPMYTLNTLLKEEFNNRQDDWIRDRVMRKAKEMACDLLSGVPKYPSKDNELQIKNKALELVTLLSTQTIGLKASRQPRTSDIDKDLEDDGYVEDCKRGLDSKYKTDPFVKFDSGLESDCAKEEFSDFNVETDSMPRLEIRHYKDTFPQVKRNDIDNFYMDTDSDLIAHTPTPEEENELDKKVEEIINDRRRKFHIAAALKKAEAKEDKDAREQLKRERFEIRKKRTPGRKQVQKNQQEMQKRVQDMETKEKALKDNEKAEMIDFLKDELATVDHDKKKQEYDEVVKIICMGAAIEEQKRKDMLVAMAQEIINDPEIKEPAMAFEKTLPVFSLIGKKDSKEEHMPGLIYITDKFKPKMETRKGPVNYGNAPGTINLDANKYLGCRETIATPQDMYTIYKALGGNEDIDLSEYNEHLPVENQTVRDIGECIDRLRQESNDLYNLANQGQLSPQDEEEELPDEAKRLSKISSERKGSTIGSKVNLRGGVKSHPWLQNNYRMEAIRTALSTDTETFTREEKGINTLSMEDQTPTREEPEHPLELRKAPSAGGKTRVEASFIIPEDVIHSSNAQCIDFAPMYPSIIHSKTLRLPLDERQKKGNSTVTEAKKETTTPVVFNPPLFPPLGKANISVGNVDAPNFGPDVFKIQEMKASEKKRIDDQHEGQVKGQQEDNVKRSEQTWLRRVAGWDQNFHSTIAKESENVRQEYLETVQTSNTRGSDSDSNSSEYEEIESAETPESMRVGEVAPEPNPELLGVMRDLSAQIQDFIRDVDKSEQESTLSEAARKGKDSGKDNGKEEVEDKSQSILSKEQLKIRSEIAEKLDTFMKDLSDENEKIANTNTMELRTKVIKLENENGTLAIKCERMSKRVELYKEMASTSKDSMAIIEKENKELKRKLEDMELELHNLHKLNETSCANFANMEIVAYEHKLKYSRLEAMTKKVLSHLKEESPKSLLIHDERLTCCICFDNEVNTVLTHCGHLYCSKCITRLKKCSICNNKNMKHVKIFL
jgi:hypothetical protein